jgi:2-dehydropantoate 2-reductase
VLDTNGEHLHTHPHVITRPGDALPADWVLLATKAHQTPAAAGFLNVLCGPHTKVAVLQNGIDHVERVGPYVNGAEVIPTVVYCGAELLRPGHVEHRSSGFLIVPDSAGGHALEDLFADTRAGIRLTHDFLTASWQKLISNVVANGITALTCQRFEVFRDPKVNKMGQALVRECLRVSETAGAHVPADFDHVLLSGLASMPGNAGTSMLYDRLAERKLEHETLHGAVISTARRHHLATPMVDTMYALLEAISSVHHSS